MFYKLVFMSFHRCYKALNRQEKFLAKREILFPNAHQISEGDFYLELLMEN